MTLPFAAILIAGASAAAQPAVPPPAIELLAEAMVQPLERRIVAITSHDGEITVAAELLMGKYSSDAELESLCASIDDASQYASPACVLIEMYDAIRDGDHQRLASLYEPGSQRRAKLNRGETEEFEDAREDVASVRDIRPATLKVWGRFWIVGLDAVTQEGQAVRLPVGAQLIFDPQEGRFWMTEQMSLLNYPIKRIFPWRPDTKIVASPPPSATLLRFERLKDPGDDRKVRAEILGADAGIESTDLILYVKEERFPINAPPLLQMDQDELDDAGRSLRDALHILHRRATGENIPVDQVAALWHPAYRDMMRRYYQRKRSETGVGVGLTGVANSDIAVNLPELRVTSRTQTDQGVVWFAWYPDDSRPGGVKSFAILQLKNDAGEYKLVLAAFQVPSGFTDQAAMHLLGGDNNGYSGVPEAITSRHRAELQAESQPDDR